MKNSNKLSIGLALLALALVAAVAVPARAQDLQPSNALRIGSGPKGKVYELLVQDMQRVCGNQAPLVSVPSIGGIPNLMMLSANEADLGIVQLDTLREMAREGDEGIQSLQAVMPLHMNLLHILTLAEGSLVDATMVGGKAVPFTGQTKVFKRFSELRGARIAAVGSTQLLGQTLNQQLGFGLKLLTADSDDHAIKMLQAGQVQAIFTDGGWPLPSVNRLAANSGLMLAEYDIVPQPPFAIVRRNYQNLGAFKLSFLGSPNLLVTRPFKPNGETGKRVAALQACLINHLEELQEGRYQAAWKDIKNPLDTLGVPRFTRADNGKTAAR